MFMFRLTKKAMALVALCAVFLTACVIFGGCSNTASSISGGVSSAAGSGTPSQCKHENVVTLDAEDATCTETGLTEGKKCSDCDVVIVERTTVDMKAHTWGEWTQTIAPTEDDDGQEKAACSVCNTEGTRPIPALGHTHKYSYTWAHDDTHHWHPTTCNHDDVENALNKIAHYWDERVTETPTCVAKGEKTWRCLTCSKTKKEDMDIDTRIHLGYIKLVGKEATCTTTGLTDGRMCAYCRVILEAQKTIEKKPHREVVIPAVEATCTATGLTAGKKCSVCDVITVAQTTVEKKPHTEVTIPAVPATITATGLTEGKKCSVCNQIIVAQTEIPSLLCMDRNIVDSINNLPDGGSITIVLDSNMKTISDDLKNALQDENKKVVLDMSVSGIDISADASVYGAGLFRNCKSLVDVKLPTGTTKIGRYAFDGCSSLTSVKIPDGVTSIGSYAFRGCTSLTSIEIPNGVTSIGYGAFYGCTSLTTIKYTGTKNDWNTKITSFGEYWRGYVPAKGVTCSDGKTYAFVGANSSGSSFNHKLNYEI